MSLEEHRRIERDAAQLAVSSGIVGEECLLPKASSVNEVRDQLRARCIDSLYFLCKAVLGFKDMTPELHGWMAREIQSDVKLLLMLVPRGHFKSSLGTIGGAVWELINDLPHTVPSDLTALPPCNDRILLVNASEDLVCHFVKRIESVWERNAMFKWLFPETIPDFTARGSVWSRNEMTVRRDGDYADPSVRAVGVKGKITGFHPNRIIWDDLVEREAAESPAVMEMTTNFLRTSFSLFDNPSEDIGRMYGTRWHVQDTYKTIMEEMAFSQDTGRGFRIHVRSATENGKPIFPERFSLEYLAQLQKQQGVWVYALQYNNDPLDPAIHEFDTDLLRTYTVDVETGRLTFPAFNPATQREEVLSLLPSQMDRIGLHDPALGEKKKTPDKAAPAIVVTGTADVFGSMAIFVLFAWTGQLHTGRQLDRIYEANEKFKCRGWVIEPAAFQRALKRWIEERNRRDDKGFVSYIETKVRTRQSKEDHIRGLLDPLNHRRIYVPEGAFELRKQLGHAPYGRPIDLPDALALGLPVWRNPGKLAGEESEEQRAVDEEKLREQNIGRTGY